MSVVFLSWAVDYDGSMTHVWSPKGCCARFVLREDHRPKTPQVWSPKGW